MGAVAFVGFLVVTGLWASASAAQDSTPEIAVPAPSWARSIEIVNDGVQTPNRSTGLGLRMATIEALEHSGIVEFGPLPPDQWHVRLIVPPPPGSEADR